MATREISNNDDVIDSRDVIARIEELEDLVATEEISEDNGAEPQKDDNGETIENIATCGECGLSWNDALITGRTPAPSARCPYEHIHDEIRELTALKSLAEEGESSPDWQYGETLIRDDYFTRYIEELIADCYKLPKEMKSGEWPWRHMAIDYEAAAEEAKADYMAVDFDGVTYWIRA